MMLLLKIVTILGLGIASIWTFPPTQADNHQTLLYLQNVPLQDEKLLIVNLTLENVDDLYGAEIQLGYNPAQLKVRDSDSRLDGVQIKPGPLIDFDNRFVVQNMAEAETGLVDFAFTLLKSAPPIEGEGVLATIVFEITGSGPFSVEVVDAQLVASNFEAIPVIKQNLYIDEETAPAEVESSLVVWEIWRVLAFVGLPIGLILIVLLTIRWSRAKASTELPPPRPVRRLNPASGASTRSAALLARQGHRVAGQGNSAQAYELFNQAIELDPANVEAWLGKGLAAQQETEKLICLQRALALDPDNETAKAALQQLRKP